MRIIKHASGQRHGKRPFMRPNFHRPAHTHTSGRTKDARKRQSVLHNSQRRRATVPSEHHLMQHEDVVCVFFWFVVVRRDSRAEKNMPKTRLTIGNVMSYSAICRPLHTHTHKPNSRRPIYERIAPIKSFTCADDDDGDGIVSA